MQKNDLATKLTPFRYEERDVQIRAHHSSNGWIVMTLAIKWAYSCDDEGPGDGSLAGQAFALDPTGKVRLFGPDLVLVDAGDYDSDGHSQLIFKLSLYNRGGYVLFSDNFIEQARFVFGYH